jgi:hypothetical protein
MYKSKNIIELARALFQPRRHPPNSATYFLT